MPGNISWQINQCIQYGWSKSCLIQKHVRSQISIGSSQIESCDKTQDNFYKYRSSKLFLTPSLQIPFTAFFISQYIPPSFSSLSQDLFKNDIEGKFLIFITAFQEFWLYIKILYTQNASEIQADELTQLISDLFGKLKFNQVTRGTFYLKLAIILAYTDQYLLYDNKLLIELISKETKVKQKTVRT